MSRPTYQQVVDSLRSELLTADERGSKPDISPILKEKWPQAETFLLSLGFSNRKSGDSWFELRQVNWNKDVDLEKSWQRQSRHYTDEGVPYLADNIQRMCGTIRNGRTGPAGIAWYNPKTKKLENLDCTHRGIVTSVFSYEQANMYVLHCSAEMAEEVRKNANTYLSGEGKPEQDRLEDAITEYLAGGTTIPAMAIKHSVQETKIAQRVKANDTKRILGGLVKGLDKLSITQLQRIGQAYSSKGQDVGLAIAKAVVENPNLSGSAIERIAEGFKGNMTKAERKAALAAIPSKAKATANRIAKGGGKARRTTKEKLNNVFDFLGSVRNSKNAKDILATADDVKRWNKEMKLFSLYLSKR